MKWVLVFLVFTNACVWLHHVTFLPQFGELDVYATDDGASLSTDAEDDEDVDYDSDLDTAAALQMFEDGDIVRSLLLRAGLSSSDLDAPVASLGEVSLLQEALRDKLMTNPGAAGGFLMGLRLVLTDILKVRVLGSDG